MARIDISYAKCLYFCGVKSQRRHEVAGSASVFRAHHFIGKKIYHTQTSAVVVIPARLSPLRT